MELELKDYLMVVRKRLWMIVTIVLVACLTTGVVSYFFLKPVYEARTKLIVNKSNDMVGTNPSLDLNTVNLNIRLIDTYKEIIKTARIMDKVAQQHPEFNMTADQLIDKVKVSSVNNTQVMTLVVQDDSYEKAVNIVNAVSKIFIDDIPQIYKVDNVSLLDEAKLTDNPAPVKPNKKLNVAISLVVSLMIALGLAFLLEYLDDTIKTESDVEKILGLPTLTMITKMSEQDMTGYSSNTEKQKMGENTNNVTLHG
jgi:capsular polysaccharide biosynthesis protein